MVPRKVMVRFRLAETESNLPQFGNSGEVAVYTDSAKPISVVRKIILRMTSLMYYFG